jgi:glycosyltransferase involved in cell wall biosynthesis
MRIAWFTPFTARSAIGHYSEAILDKLSERDEVTIYTPDRILGEMPRATSHPLVRMPFNATDDLLAGLESYDACIYNMGNHLPNHRQIYEVALRKPGIVVLHDLVMRDFFIGYILLHRKNAQGLVRMMAYNHGPETAENARIVVRQGQDVGPDDPIRLRHPMFKSALHRCRGVVVHSEYAHKRVAEAVSVPTVKLDFPAFGPGVQALEGDSSRRKNKVRLLTFGVLTPNKLVHATIEAIAGSTMLRDRVHFSIIGEEGAPGYGQRLCDLIEEHHLDGIVEVLGRRSDKELVAALRESDVVVNLRNPHGGEGSASLVDALLAGLPAVVWDHGFYGEFPDEVVCKVRSQAELAPALERLVGDAGLRERMGRGAQAHARGRFRTERYCEGLRGFIDHLLGRIVPLRLTDRVSDHLLELGIRAEDRLVQRMADEIGFFLKGEEAA